MAEAAPWGQADASNPLGLHRLWRSASERKALAAEERTGVVRFLVVVFNIVSYWLWLHPTGLGSPALAAVVAAIALVYAVFDLLFQPHRHVPVLATSAWTTFTDAVLITLWIHATGGFGSPYYVLWYLSLVAVAFRFDWRATLVAAALYSAVYVGLLAATDALAGHGVAVTIRVAYILLCGGLGAILAAESMRVFQADVVLDERARRVERSSTTHQTASRFLAAVVDSSVDGILTKDLDGKITSWNAACEALFGYKAQEVLGKPVTVIYPPGKEAEVVNVLARIRAGHPVRIPQAKRVRKDGSTVWVSITASPLRDGQGKVVGCATIKRDLTDARAAERERLQAKAQVQEFTRLKEVNRFKTEFINTAAHELRTPLLPLRMQLDLMLTNEEDPPSPSQMEAMEVMRRNLERLSVLVEDLLTVARSQAGRIQLVLAPVDLAQLVREAQQTFRTLAAKRGIQLTVDSPPKLAVLGDGKRIAQVLANLLSNAFKFTPPGGEVKVTLRSEGEGARVSVSDTGAGIAAADVGRLFEPFVQVHDVTEVTQPGSGLGLYICRQLVELHGGVIACSSDGRGQGSTFWFTLPGTPAPAEAPATATPWNPTP